MAKYLDLKIEHGGLMMDDGQQPLIVTDIASVAQDIRHTILASGLARKLLGNRSGAERGDVLTEIELLVEQDFRLQAGSIWITETEDDRYLLQARTLDEVAIEMELPR